MAKVTSGELVAEDRARLRRHAQTAFHVSELPDHIVDELGTVALPNEASQLDDEYDP